MIQFLYEKGPLYEETPTPPRPTKERIRMDIAIIADDKRKELMIQFCIAYCGILSKHRLYATGVTGKTISDATGLDIELLMQGQGGSQQIASRIAYNEIDVLFYFRDPERDGTVYEEELLRQCDLHNVPVATNIASGEVMVLALEKGLLDWRDLVNPRSARNKPKSEETKLDASAPAEGAAAE